MLSVFPVKSAALLALAAGVDSDVARGAWHPLATRSAANVRAAACNGRLI
jgi:hypothetical protein